MKRQDKLLAVLASIPWGRKNDGMGGDKHTEIFLNELALFAGAGGGILGGILCGFRTVCAVEKEPYCREVLLRRQRDGVLPLFPIWDNVQTFDGLPWRGLVDIVTAGFPCQPFSVANRNRSGAGDDRNLWPETVRVIREVGPRYSLLENVANLLAHDYFGEILGDLAEIGLDVEWGVVRAADVGAPHIRARLWLVAYSHGDGLPAWLRGRFSAIEEERDIADLVRIQALWDRKVAAECHRGPSGVAHRVDRLRATGNGQVPRVAQEAWQRLTE